jgi:O-antigen ligase
MKPLLQNRLNRTADKGLFYCTLAMLFLPLIFVPGSPRDDFFYKPKFVVLTVLSIIACVLLLTKILTRDDAIKISVLDGMAVLFFGLCAIAALLSVAPKRSIYGVMFRYEGLITQLGYAMCFFAASFSLLTKKRRTDFFRVLVLVTVLVSVYGMVQYLGLDPAPRDDKRFDIWWQYQSFASLANPHYFADFLLLTITAFGLLVLGCNESLTKNAAVFGSVFLSFVSSIVRAGYFAAVVCGVVAMIIARKMGCLMWKRVVLLVVIILVAFSFVEIYGRLKRYYYTPLSKLGIMARADGGTEEQSLTGRSMVWAVALEAVFEHPLFGWGQETFFLQDKEIKGRIALSGQTVLPAVFDRAENQYLQVAYDCGIPAAIVYIVLIVLSVVLLIRFGLRSGVCLGNGTVKMGLVCAGLGIGVIGYGIEQIFSFATINQAATFWLILGFASAIAKIGDE